MCILNPSNEIIGEYVINGNSVCCYFQSSSSEANEYLSLKATEVYISLQRKELFSYVMRQVIDTAITQGVLVKYDKYKINIKRLLELYK